MSVHLARVALVLLPMLGAVDAVITENPTKCLNPPSDTPQDCVVTISEHNFAETVTPGGTMKGRLLVIFRFAYVCTPTRV